MLRFRNVVSCGVNVVSVQMGFAKSTLQFAK